MTVPSSESASDETPPGGRRWLPAALLVVLGVVLIVFALTRGLVSFSARPEDSLLNSNFDCGNALQSDFQGGEGLIIEFTPEGGAATPDGADSLREDEVARAEETCDEERTSRRVVAGVTGVLGLAALVGSFVLARRARDTAEPTEMDAAD